MTDAELAAVVRGIAPIVREQIATAVGDLTPRLAAIEATLAGLPAHEHAVADLRDRVVIVETKATLAPALDAASIDLTHVFERLAAAEARMQTLGDLRDRVVTIETKAAGATDLGDLPTRVAVLETQTAGLDGRVTALEQEQETLAAAARGFDAALAKDLAIVRERVAVVEVRQPVPGPAGERGENGTDGRNGTVDELRLKCVPVTERSFQLYAGDGVPIEGGLLELPIDIYRGVYQDGKTYERGDGVTWAGSAWHCNEPTTTKPGDGSRAWTLRVKRGRDGRDGKDAPGAPPVVSVGGGR